VRIASDRLSATFGDRVAPRKEINRDDLHVPDRPHRSAIPATPVGKQHLFVLRLKRANSSVEQGALHPARGRIQSCVRRDEDDNHSRHGIDENCLAANAAEREVRLAWIDKPCLKQ
jgi:hypothetical protein